MERLILMRHGDALGAASGQEDFDRGLSVEGRAEARGVGRALAEAGFSPDLALVSAARRTQETWKAASEAFSGVAVELDRELYAASSYRLAAAVREASGRAGVLMLVGHNPGVHQLALHLARKAGTDPTLAAPLFERFPTGTAVVFQVDEAGDPAFERLFLAKHYRGGA